MYKIPLTVWTGSHLGGFVASATQKSIQKQIEFMTSIFYWSFFFERFYVLNKNNMKCGLFVFLSTVYYIYVHFFRIFCQVLLSVHKHKMANGHTLILFDEITVINPFGHLTRNVAVNKCEFSNENQLDNEFSTSFLEDMQYILDRFSGTMKENKRLRWKCHRSDHSFVFNKNHKSKVLFIFIYFFWKRKSLRQMFQALCFNWIGYGSSKQLLKANRKNEKEERWFYGLCTSQLPAVNCIEIRTFSIFIFYFVNIQMDFQQVEKD